ncbi:hypothetical protein BGZ98_006975 [Dissophora globulifera]|nr:hypothetical protein BGZ98_006975 [Dissophora globulifera]
MKEQFKDSTQLIPKLAFTGDPNQAHWISDFDHIAPYAKIDHRHHQLLLRTRRDMVKTQSGGGFGATVSSTRWSKYGTFSVKLRSGSTGPGIVTAILLSNPALGEEISFELTGKDPKQVVTNYYRRVPSVVDDRHPPDMNIVSHTSTRLVSHEETLPLKRDSTTNDLVYKIEWNERMIRWSVDGKVLRTVHAKDIASNGGLPENAMQLKLTIWDAGYASETMAWAGGKTDYGADNLDEYIAAVSRVDVACQNPKEGNKPWPGPDATKRLKMEAERLRKMGKGPGMFSSAKSFYKIAVLSLIKWTCVLLAIICGAAYFTDPKRKTGVPK